MNNRKIEDKLKTAVSHATPDILEQILSDLPEQNDLQAVSSLNTDSHDFNSTPASEKGARDFGSVSASPRKKRLRTISSIAAAVLLFIGIAGLGMYRSNIAVYSTIGIDVNPSLEIMINKSQTVVDAVAYNEGAADIMGGMDLKGAKLDVAVNALIGSMLRNGFISDLANSILISVENNDDAKAQELQQKLTEEINSIFSTSAIDGSVLSQTVAPNQDSAKLADQYNISSGKASLINDIVSKSNRYTFEELSKLSINELALILNSSSIKLDEVSSTGTPSEKAYIGKDAAKSAAVSDAGADISKLTAYEIELDSEDGTLVYEVEFTYNGIEYEYELDAVSGKILKNEKKNSHGSESGNMGSSPGSSGTSSHAEPNHNTSMPDSKDSYDDDYDDYDDDKDNDHDDSNHDNSDHDDKDSGDDIYDDD